MRCASVGAVCEMFGHWHRRAFDTDFFLTHTAMGAHNRRRIRSLSLFGGGRVVTSGSNGQHVLWRAHRPQEQDRTLNGELRRKAHIVGWHVSFAVEWRRNVEARRRASLPLACTWLLLGHCPAAVSPCVDVQGVGLRCNCLPLFSTWSIGAGSSVKFVCTFGALGHRQGLVHQRRGVVAHFSLSQAEFQKLWSGHEKDTILKPTSDEKFSGRASVCLLLLSYSQAFLNLLTATNKTKIRNYFNLFSCSTQSGRCHSGHFANFTVSRHRADKNC